MRSHLQAETEAERLERRARLLELLDRFRGEPSELLPFHQALALRPKGERHLGLRAIEVDKVVGSVDRYEDFDRRFLPKTPHALERWKRLRALQLEGQEFPPIEVYQVGEAYFVKDGNHRVALAKATGQKYLDAYVIALDVPVPVEAKDTLKDLILKAEYANFLEKTRLKELVPEAEEIRFSTLGRYDILLDHIATRRYFRGLEEGREIPWEEAVVDWYQNLYRPTVEAIRKLGLLAEFPGRTEADLYLWVMDHRYFLARELGVDLSPEEAAR
ncbi:MAG: transcriptional regulator, partial [Thermus sp.]